MKMIDSLEGRRRLVQNAIPIPTCSAEDLARNSKADGKRHLRNPRITDLRRYRKDGAGGEA
jgi:hypothetical protein